MFLEKRKQHKKLAIGEQNTLYGKKIPLDTMRQLKDQRKSTTFDLKSLGYMRLAIPFKF